MNRKKLEKITCRDWYAENHFKKFVVKISAENKRDKISEILKE